jgi:hypothetical protein
MTNTRLCEVANGGGVSVHSALSMASVVLLNRVLLLPDLLEHSYFKVTS